MDATACTPTTEQLLKLEEQNRKTRAMLREAASGACLPPDFALAVRFRDGTLSELQLKLNQWCPITQWRFKLFELEPGRASALVEANGTFAFGVHQHACHEVYRVRRGVLEDVDPETGETVIVGEGDFFAVEAGEWHSPKVISDGCVLYIEWTWPGDSRVPPGFSDGGR